MMRKLIAIAIALALNAIVLTGFYVWSTDAVARAAPSQSEGTVRTLPEVTVRPTRAQIELLRRGDVGVRAGAHGETTRGANHG